MNIQELIEGQAKVISKTQSDMTTAQAKAEALMLAIQGLELLLTIKKRFDSSEYASLDP